MATRQAITAWTDPCGCKWRRECRDIKLVKGLPQKVYGSWKISIPCSECRVKGPRNRPDFPWLRPKFLRCTRCQARLVTGYKYEQCHDCRQLELF